MFSTNRHALVVAYLALILAMSGTAYAITVDGGDVVNGSLTGRDIKSSSIPEGDLGFNAVAVGNINMSNVFSETPLAIAPKDGPTAIASVESTIGEGFDSLYGVATFSITNSGQTPTRIEIRPYLNGKPHGANHHFIGVIQSGATNIETISIQCNATPGPYTVELRIEVIEGDGVTINEREWHVAPMPMP